MTATQHPGIVVKSEIDKLGLSVTEAAAALGVSRAELHQLIRCEVGLSPEMALRLEAVIGSTVRAWLRLQADYETTLAERQRDVVTRGLRRIAPISSAR
ncbi:MAG: HigA family addiction module antitoxin [Ahrensia sp.]|nr:HigA family addiction module antitoxin [Ahrensia sp.]